MQLCRGTERPDLIVAGTNMFATFEDALMLAVKYDFDIQELIKEQ